MTGVTEVTGGEMPRDAFFWKGQSKDVLYPDRFLHAPAEGLWPRGERTLLHEDFCYTTLLFPK